MARLRILSIHFGALAVLWIGAAGAPAMAANDTDHPCHDMAAGSDTDQKTPASGQMKAMGCCVACVAVALPQPVARPAMSPSPATHPSRPGLLPGGERPAPEHGPPRAVVA